MADKSIPEDFNSQPEGTYQHSNIRKNFGENMGINDQSESQDFSGLLDLGITMPEESTNLLGLIPHNYEFGFNPVDIREENFMGTLEGYNNQSYLRPEVTDKYPNISENFDGNMGMNDQSEYPYFPRLPDQEITMPNQRGTCHLETIPYSFQLGFSPYDQTASTSNPTVQMWQESNIPHVSSADSKFSPVGQLQNQASSSNSHFVSSAINPYHVAPQQYRPAVGPQTVPQQSISLVVLMPGEIKQMISNNYDESRSCKCPKSECIKLYCDCFMSGMYCGDSCKCKGCFNRKRFEDTVEQARDRILADNPLAFVPKHIKSVTSTFMENGVQRTKDIKRNKSGCSCKNSKCAQQYCDCFRAKMGCSSECKCGGCQNSFGIKIDTDQSIEKKSKKRRKKKDIVKETKDS